MTALQAVATALRGLPRGVVSLVYPPTCAGCGSATADPGAFCPSCWSSLRLIEEPVCQRYGTPFALDLGVGPLVSPRAIAEPPVFGRARAVALYDAVARRIVHRLKYEDRLDLAGVMARMMAASGRTLIAEAECLVPVPLHRGRLWRRRFNQSALLARAIAASAGRPCVATALVRVRATRSQVGLSRAARAENLSGAFRVTAAEQHRIRGRRVLLVDDVMTTGATGNAAARALLRGGATSVDLLTFALVGDPAG
ncbi:ComF family protein [Methylobacterium sp. PvP062]|jgi:ComF family protein|uniref:Competence protein F n=2 Tax=Methylobacterium radiotolerans TaxID=31998 RepID=B1M248_METRJ|nr:MULTISPECIES: ComF family protein [Methylobacterium]MCX7332260.1 ComF family protein [Hyphomicrobiales bacterium]GAN52238.1 competence protein F [Methylobacterium sp. ME121]ACB24659.1 competence protein F [Methylobacterium radiotolerans JCM 2831]KIU33285.1 competence protein ComF [Methylobacterium radiotolerans]KTS11026.1 competence protein ComF [Methylobacterium radiotolerans]